MGSKQPSTTTSITKNEPWDAAKPFFNEMYARAVDAMRKTNKNPFTGDFIAEDNGQVQQGLDMLQNNVTSGTVGQGSKDFLDMAQATARGDYLSPDSNPFIKQTAEAAMRPITENLMQKALPGVRDASIAQGAYGGSRQDLQENQAITNWQRDASDATSRIYASNYAQERQNQMASGDLLAQGYDLARAPGLELMRIGDTQRAENQRTLDNTYQKFLEQKQAPWYGLGELSQILTAGGFRTTDSKTTAPKQDSTASWLQGGAGILGAIASIAALSDRRAKTDIKKLGKDKETGLDVYSYKYKGDSRTVVGPMAQDVEKKYPDEVIELDGMKFVSHEMMAKVDTNPFLKAA